MRRRSRGGRPGRRAWAENCDRRPAGADRPATSNVKPPETEDGDPRLTDPVLVGLPTRDRLSSARHRRLRGTGLVDELAAHRRIALVEPQGRLQPMDTASKKHDRAGPRGRVDLRKRVPRPPEVGERTLQRARTGGVPDRTTCKRTAPEAGSSRRRTREGYGRAARDGRRSSMRAGGSTLRGTKASCSRPGGSKNLARASSTV